MDRLTKHSKQTSHENGICCTHFYGPECLGVGGNCAMNCKWEEAAWSRLAAYEDTGLMPGDVEELIKMATSKTNKVLQLKEELHAMKNELQTVIGKAVLDAVHGFAGGGKSDGEETPQAGWIPVYESEMTGWNPSAAGRDPIGGYFCSKCHYEAVYSCNDEYVLSDYCPGCGARMAGGTK